MIIGEALKRLFDGLVVDTYFYDKNDVKQLAKQKVQFHYGDHKELIKWTIEMSDLNAVKYPLLWYVTSPYQDEENDFKRCKSRLIILFSFKDMAQYSWFNHVKSKRTYDAVIEPVWNSVKKLLVSKPDGLQILGDRNKRYTIKDEPNYGVTTDGARTSQDFSKTTTSDESITLDWVDGRVIELDFRINTKCI